ncbi:hypothetical protein C482_04154 [Natrialba chahannaoensis JCM 10990]|uniref:Uncharacterized protein n=1 Tax=Natrialba chahannaoensis JCM 10990 TaxID=1227492 RepID=M0AYX9_9EURY|nr:hypothetical protein C482_04154 [Natrialba chahannaoensis JCM 10990]
MFSLSAIVVVDVDVLESGRCWRGVPETGSSSTGLSSALEDERADGDACSQEEEVASLSDDRSSGRRALSGHSLKEPNSSDCGSDPVAGSQPESALDPRSEPVSESTVSAVSADDALESVSDAGDVGHAVEGSGPSSVSSRVTQSRTVSAARLVTPLESVS